MFEQLYFCCAIPNTAVLFPRVMRAEQLDVMFVCLLIM